MTASVMRYIKLVMMMLLVAHWNGCLGFLVPMMQNFPHKSWVALNELQVRFYRWNVTGEMFIRKHYTGKIVEKKTSWNILLQFKNIKLIDHYLEPIGRLTKK